MWPGRSVRKVRIRRQNRKWAEQRLRKGPRWERTPQGEASGWEPQRTVLGTARRKVKLPRSGSARLTGPDAGARSPGDGCRIGPAARRGWIEQPGNTM